VIRIGVEALAWIVLFSCVSADADRASCPLRSEKPMAIAQLFFGRAIEGRAPLTDAEWSSFAAGVLSRDFPDGFTAFDGEGQWLDPSTRTTVREPSKIVVVAAKDDENFVRNVRQAVDAYKKAFRQRSVGVITEPACAAF
jgi:hypothetical protein